MPTFEHHGASIYYEEFGKGFPILTFAPAGLQSTIAVWSGGTAPVNPTTEFAASCKTPCLVLAGNDEAHPRPISDETAKLLPNSEYITEWKEGAPLEAAKVRIRQFLAKHTPVAA